MTKANLYKLIVEKCLDCCCGNTAEVERCIITDCALFPVRNARCQREERMQNYSDEQLEVFKSRAKYLPKRSKDESNAID